MSARASGLAALLALGLLSGRASAQAVSLGGTQHLAFDRTESWAMARGAALTLPGSFGPPEETHLGQLGLGLEAANIPYLSAADRTVGFEGTKVEDLNKVPVLGRPRATLGLPWDLTVQAAYVPPVTIGGATPSLFQAGIGRPVVQAGDFRLGLRAYGQTGSIHGDYTCTAAQARAGADQSANPFGCHSASDDRISLHYLGLELGGAYRIAPAHNLELHLAAAGTYMDLAFQVNASYGNVQDSTRLATTGVVFSSQGGLMLPITERFRLAADAFYAPLWVQRPGQARDVEGLFNFHGLIQYTFF